MNAPGDYYVYCYIDPRNLEEFYYGKGTGSRSSAHLLAQGRSKKAARIRQIRADGVEPTIRIIAADLTSDEAFMIEAALIWKLGERLTNENAGHYKSKFRPKNTLHKKLVGFDFSTRIHYFDVGDPWRSWEDCRKHGFLSAGYGPKYSNQVRQLHKEDVVVAFLRGHGYVGIGRITEEAVRARDFRCRNKALNQLELNVTKICHDSDNPKKSEYLVKVKWLVAKPREDAIWKKNFGLLAFRGVRASLEHQPKTLHFIERSWGVKFDEILEKGFPIVEVKLSRH